MFKNKLADYETYFKGLGNNYEVESSLACYEVFIETSRDKDGNVLKNKDGSDRYHAIDDSSISELSEDVLVKEIRENFYKDVFEVNGDTVEKVDRDNKRIYFVVDPAKLKTLTAGTRVVRKNDTYRIPSEIGYVLIDNKDIEHPKIVAVRKFKTDDHKAEAEKIVRGGKHKKQEPEVSE